MKRFLVVAMLSCIAVVGLSQENLVTLAGGYSFSSFDGSDYSEEKIKVTGWRINGLYEFNANEGPIAHGISIGYLSMKGSPENSDSVEYKVSSLPIFYAPKYMFGNEKVKGFVKGALGMHHTQYERTGLLFITDASTWGFYGGLGAGVMLFVSESVFIDVEYEFAWLSNSYYQDGLMNTVMGGVGFRF
jgi:opacity protein-like surface antigen